MLKSINILGYVTILFALTMWSCASGPVSEESDEVMNEAVEENAAANSEKIVYYGTPSLVEVASLMKASGAQFSGEVMNELENSQNYVEQHIKAINLGVYGADLTYAAMFDHTQEAINYLKTVKDMAEELGLTSAFEEELITSIESNISNRDSLLDVITDFYWSADAYLMDNDRAEVASLIITGGWVESMYLACHMYKTNPENQELKERIAEQKLILKNLVLFLQGSAGDDAHIVEVREKMRELSEFYNTIEITHTSGENETNTDEGLTMIGNETEIVIDAAQLDELCNRIGELRMFFVN